MPGIFDSSGRPVALGQPLGTGGEGTVYELPSDPSRAAKIYNGTVDSQRSEKLRTMVALARDEIVTFSAWPISTLHRKDKIVGFVMNKIPRSDKPIHELYSPKSRLREFPSANWQFLIHTAANIARGFAAIHKAGHVIGDVNHGNILVASKGTTAFIDCDSFQIRANGKLFACEVGVPEYTPPELQNRSFVSIGERTPNHDAFGLAVLIFHLLFMGRHPFAGRFLGAGEMPIARAITECRFPFGRLARAMQMQPPPQTLLLTQIPTPLADAFERSFSPEATRGAWRTSPLEWIGLLESASAELVRCKTNQSHLYFSRLPSCPWCAIERQGVILFFQIGDSLSPGIGFDTLWRTLTDLPALGTPQPAPNAEKFSGTAAPEYKANGARRRASLVLGILGVVGTVGAAATLNLEGDISAALVFVAIIIAFYLPRRYQGRRSEAAAKLKAQQQQFEALQNRYFSECDEKPFTSKISYLETLRKEYFSLPSVRQRKLQELEKNKYQIQLIQYLDQFSLATAKIDGIGEGRKQMLASFGIDSAADLNQQNLNRVPGFGPKLAGRLFGWRMALEKRFRFDAKKGIDPIEISKIDQEIRTRRAQIEQSISGGIHDAIITNKQIQARRAAYQSQLENGARLLAQARANYKAS